MVLGADIYFWRQCIVLIADIFHSVGIGFILSFPSVLNPAILSPNTTDIRVTKDQASWISSTYGFAGVIGFCIIPGIMQMYGRKIVHIGMNSVVSVGFIMLALADNVATLYAARFIQGLCNCGVYITNIILAEYVHPKRRGYFISFKKSTVALGSLICHSLVLVCSWRQIAAIAAVFSLLGAVLTFPWPESPAFLAMKGRFAECDKTYLYLNGDTPSNRKELNDLIAAQIERRKIEDREARMDKKLTRIFKKLIRKDFLKPFFIITLLTVIIDSGGRYYNLAYIVQIVKDITGDNSLGIYCSIGLDILTMIACWGSSYIITKFARRTMLFTFGYFSVTLMFLISLIVYLKTSFAAGVLWLTPSIILFNSFIFNLGVIPVCFTVSGEIFPLEHRGIGTTATGIIFTLLFAITIKCTPIMMEETGIEGTYGIYGLCLVICLLILHFILTETKDKTLQEIEDEIKGIERDTDLVQERELLPTLRIYSSSNNQPAISNEQRCNS